MSKKVKEPMNTEQIYKRNKRRAKIFSVLAPITWYVLLLLTILFLCLMLKNSIGNVTEILELLDEDNYSGTEIIQNYAYLVEKWGEWEIIGADSAGLVIRYVNVGNALFSGLMITFSTLSFVSFCAAILFGKIMFPLLAKHFINSNEEMVDMATLRSASQIEQISKTKEWF